MPSAEAGEAPTHDGPGRDFPLGVPGFTYQDLHRDERLADLDRVVPRRARPRGCGPRRAARGVPPGPGVARSARPFAPARRGGAAPLPLRRPPLRNRGRLEGAGRERRSRSRALPIPPRLPAAPGRQGRASRRRRRRAVARRGRAPSSGSSSPSWRGRRTPSSRPREPSSSSWSSRAPFSRRSARRRFPKSTPGPARGRPSSPDAPRLRRRRPCAAPPARRTRSLLAFLESLLDTYARWCRARMARVELRREISAWVSFHLPETLDYAHLVETERPEPRRCPRSASARTTRRRRRDGLRAHRPAHDARARSSARRTTASSATTATRTRARKGFATTKTRRVQEEPARRRARRLPARREDLARCTRCGSEGDAIGALALVCVDNPMCPGTGHRICNDCMKACIFQKQEPVNIPQIETRRAHRRARRCRGASRSTACSRAGTRSTSTRPVRAALQRQERARRRPRPGRLHARAPPA